MFFFELIDVLSSACEDCRQTLSLIQNDNCVKNVIWRNNQRHSWFLSLSGKVPSAAVIVSVNAVSIDVSSVRMHWRRPCWRQRKTPIRLARASCAINDSDGWSRVNPILQCFTFLVNRKDKIVPSKPLTRLGASGFLIGVIDAQSSSQQSISASSQWVHKMTMAWEYSCNSASADRRSDDEWTVTRSITCMIEWSLERESKSERRFKILRLVYLLLASGFENVVSAT